jgi:hypothetical protein
MLKSKFQSLQNLPVKTERKADLDKTIFQIMACVTLHNFIRWDVAQEIVDDEN